MGLCATYAMRRICPPTNFGLVNWYNLPLVVLANLGQNIWVNVKPPVMMMILCMNYRLMITTNLG